MHLPEEIITSRQNQYVVLTGKLNDRKYREAERLFRCDGIKMYCEAVSRGVEIAYILLRASDCQKVLTQVENLYGEKVAQADHKVLVLEDFVFDKITEEKSPEGIITVGKYIDKNHKIITINNNTIFEGSFCVLLESVRDPSNVGTILRTSAALGADRVILSSDCADLYHPKTLRATMGTLFSLSVDRVDNMPACIQALQRNNHRVMAAALDEQAEKLGEMKPQKGDCIVIGNEGHGLSQETIHACDKTVYIPMRAGVESLNAAAAAAVLIWQFSQVHC